MNDASDIYRDLAFPGRRFLSWSVGIWAAVSFFPALIFKVEALPEWANTLRGGCLAIALVLYFVGYWKAVVGKGYSKVLFIAAFTPVIGIVLIFFMPSLRAVEDEETSKREQGGAGNPLPVE